MKYTIKKKMFACIFSLVMVVCLFPIRNAQAETTLMKDTKTVTITFSAQSGDYDVNPMEIPVTDGLAEAYGYEVATKDHNGVEITGPTVFDALVAVHKVVYGKIFTPSTAKQYLDISGGYLSTAFENPAYTSTISVNGVSSNDGILNEAWGTYGSYAHDCAPLAEGDDVQYNVIQDTVNWADYYTWFENGKSVTADKNEALTFSLKGYPMVFYGSSPKETIDENTLSLAGVSIYAKKSNGSMWIEIGATDEKGQFSYGFDAYGEYEIKAMGTYMGTPVMVSMCQVIVEEPLPFWQSFGKNQNNNPVVSVKTPIDEDTVQAKWISESLLGLNWEGISAPVITEEAMYVAQEKYLTKISLETGLIVLKSELAKALSLAPASIAYGDGMIFVAEDSCIEAFDAETLELKWVYNDPIGGQAMTNVYYKDGMVYTGYYNLDAEGRKTIANYVCIKATADKDTEEIEVKDAQWTYQTDASYYWAGAYATDSVVVFGAEAADGTDMGKVISVDKSTGEEIDLLVVNGNVRSDISYSEESGSIYFTTDGGYLYETTIMRDGSFASTTEISLGGKSTSTPVVYKHRAYVGVSGPSQFGTEGHTVKVIDLTTNEIVYEVPMNGFPQCTLLLTNAYEQETGKIYLYATANASGAGITVIEDSAGQAEAISYDLYIPDAQYQNYCATSVVCDEKGTLYYRNDTGRIFALEESNETKILYGDVDGNGGVAAADALLVLKAVVKIETLTDVQTKAADVNVNGEVTAEDALNILKCVVKLLPGLPIK